MVLLTCQQRHRIDNVLNAEMAWNEFCDDILESSSETTDKLKYIRINPDLGDDVPSLDEKKQIFKLQTKTKAILQSPEMKAKIHNTANRLVASLFYYERKSPPTHGLDDLISCKGM